ncbi:hypothetical protein AVEN_135988-1 [Araneus ventricosus]|uniref:CCHC-type domain-containing protein n=1 Tax=Araneus ventricosus TaxID=182803 RepID=A0A4Y2LCK4_ARAVE|nr:hypothetical protein AVEN_135988-1 [Araneus ventricosus]
MTIKRSILVAKKGIRHTLEVRRKKLTKVFERKKECRCYHCSSTGYFRSNCPQLKQSESTAFVNWIINAPDNDLISPYTVNGEVNGFKMPILPDTGTTVDIVSRNRIRPEILTGEHIWVQQTFDEKPICLPLAEVELKGKFGQFKTKAAVVCSEADKVKYLLGNCTATLLGKDRERLLFPKLNGLQTRAQKRVTEQKKETDQLRNNFSKGIKTKEVGKFRNSKVSASYVSTPRNSDVTARTNEAANQLRTINEEKRFQRRTFSEVQSPATSTCTSKNDTNIKFVTKISKRPSNKINIGEISVGKLSLLSNEMAKSNTRRYNDMSVVESKMKISKIKSLVKPNKNNVSVNAIEKSHSLHSKVISEGKGNEALDTISQVKCQESGNKAFSIKTVSDINQEIRSG